MCKAHQAQTRLARALDGIAYSLLAALLIVCHPGLGNTVLGDLGNLHVLPLLLLTASSLWIPGDAVTPGLSGQSVWRLKLAALVTLGLAPFVSWWIRIADSVYLLLACAAAVYAGIWYLVELAGLIREVLRERNETQLARQAGIARILVLYFTLIPTTSVYVAFTVALLLFQDAVLSDLQRTWGSVPPPVRWLMVLPILNLIWLAWRVYGAIIAAPPSDEPRPEYLHRTP